MQEMLVRIGFTDAVTPREADQHTRSLRRSLERLDIGRVDLGRTNAPPGTRTGGEIIAAVLIVGFSHVLTQVIAVIRSWLETSAKTSITLEINDSKLQMTGRVSESEVRMFLRSVEGDYSGEDTSDQDDNE